MNFDWASTRRSEHLSQTVPYISRVLSFFFYFVVLWLDFSVCAFFFNVVNGREDKFSLWCWLTAYKYAAAVWIDVIMIIMMQFFVQIHFFFEIVICINIKGPSHGKYLNDISKQWNGIFIWTLVMSYYEIEKYKKNWFKILQLNKFNLTNYMNNLTRF